MWLQVYHGVYLLTNDYASILVRKRHEKDMTIPRISSF